ncbi:MAG: amidase [Lautropia sp.]
MSAADAPGADAPNRLDAAEAARLIRAGRLGARELVEACLARIDARDDAVRAWVAIDAERALRDADAADRALREGPAQALGALHGVPIGVKDIIDTADLPTGYGSDIYRGHRPRADAACVALARAAGAIVLGKTATAEFASVHPPATRNPANLAYGPGGSSSGSAAAVADHMVPLAFGTQTAGSTIRPAAFCGVVGFKPSFGLVNRAGLKFSAESLDTIGLFGRSVDDVALFAHAVSGLPVPPGGSSGIGTDATDAKASPARRWRVGVCRTPYWSQAQAAARDAVSAAANALSNAGATLVDVELPSALDAAWDAHAILIRYEAAVAMTWETRHHRASYSPAFAARIDEGLAIPHERYRQALATAADCRRLYEQVLDVDALLTLSAPGEAPHGISHTGDSVFNRSWTLLGVPCVHLPTGAGAAGLPIGVQVVGRFGCDGALLDGARWIEAVIAVR